MSTEQENEKEKHYETIKSLAKEITKLRKENAQLMKLIRQKKKTK
jgi:hypothetical protein